MNGKVGVDEKTKTNRRRNDLDSFITYTTLKYIDRDMKKKYITMEDDEKNAI